MKIGHGIKVLQVLIILCVIKVANASTGYVTVNGTDLYYEDVGTGQPLIFITGWTTSHEFFKNQVDYFSKNYRVITLDPRGQGMSPATLEHNTYEQHGKDLAAVINKLGLKHVVLVSWSNGCRDAYSYIRDQGVHNLKAFVCIDSAPKASGNKDEWRTISASEARKTVVTNIEHNRYRFTQHFAQSMVDRQLTSEESNWMVNQILRTPGYVALLLIADASLTDYTPEVQLLDKSSIPVMNVISSPYASLARAWLKINAPHAVIVTKWDKHMMFWEHADEFNATLANFLNMVSRSSNEI